MTRLAVTADLHCDDYGSKVDPATGLNARWVDTVAMTRWIARDAAERGADVLIVAGDLSEKRHPAPWRVAQIGEALDEFGGPVILARGNHDGERAGRSIVDVLAAARPGWQGFSQQGIAILGDTAIAVIPHVDRHWYRAQPGKEATPEGEVLRDLASYFLTIARGLFVDASELAAQRVLVVHQGLSGGNMSDQQRAFLGDMALVVDTRAIAAIGYDAIVAGHFHLRQVLSEKPLVAYAGSPYRTDFSEEHQAKGYLIVDVDEAGARMEFVETPARRFVTVDGAQPFVDHDELAEYVHDAIVRVVNLEPDADVAGWRGALAAAGAFEVTEIRRRPAEAAVATGGMAEGLSAEQALDAYFADEPDREVLIERGRAILAEVAG